MRRCAWLFSFPLVLIMAMAGASGATDSIPKCTTQSKLVESTIATVARQLRAQEYCQFRRYQTLDDLDGDGVADFIVLFTVEGIGGGGNNHYDFTSVFLSEHKWHPITVKTGGRGERDPISIEVRDRKIILDTLVYQPADALCCPSGKGRLVFEIRNKQLKLVTDTKDQAEPAAPPERDGTPIR